MPLPLATNNVRLSGATASAVGIPADGNEAGDLRVARFGNVDHHHVVVVGVGHVQRLAVGGHGHGVGRAAFRGGGIKRSGEDLPHVLRRRPIQTGLLRRLFQLLRRDHVNRVVARAGREEPAVKRQGHVVGPDADGLVADPQAGRRIDDAQGAAAPVRDVKMSPVPADDAGMGMLPYGDRFLQAQVLGVEDPDFVIGLVGDV